MHKLLEELFRKRNIEGVEKLDLEEQAQFDEWEKVLSEGEITVEKITDFCRGQVKIIENQWKDLDNSNNKNERLVLLHTVYATILEIIRGPKEKRENLEKYLIALIDK